MNIFLKIFLLFISSTFLYGKNVLVDNTTGLVWQDNLDSKILKKDFVEARDYCSRLDLDNKDDWRLPSLLELETIVNNKKLNNSFINKSDDTYWSSTNSKTYPKDIAYTVYMKYSFPGLTMPKNAMLNIRCVRGKINKNGKKLLALLQKSSLNQ